ncbi:hypothetical protein HDV00_011074 [Rhizophlyctis rosea]|nr:hypothetical protein HDV00_011074 [Rhizophlyctis rosea]
MSSTIPLSNPSFPSPAAGGSATPDDDEPTPSPPNPNPAPPTFAAAPMATSPPKRLNKLKSIELVEGYRDSELASAIADLQGKHLRPVSVDEAVSRAGPLQPSRVRSASANTVPDVEEIVVPMESLAWRFRRGPTGVWTTELGTSWWSERPVGNGWDGRWRVPAEMKDNRVEPNDDRGDMRMRAMSDNAPSGNNMSRSYGAPVRRVNTSQSIDSSVTKSNMVHAQVKRLFTWKKYYDFRAGGVGGYDAGLSGALCALEASDRREHFASFLEMLEDTLTALSILEDSENDDGVDEIYSNYNEHMAQGGRVSPMSNASLAAKSVAESIARKLAAKTTQDAVEAVGLVQALGAALVDMSIEAPTFKVNVGYMPSTYNEIPLEKNDLVTLFGLIDDRVAYGLNRRTNELGFMPIAHIDQHTVYQRPAESYRPNPKRLSSRQLGLRPPGHSLNTNVIQRMAIASPTGHFRQGSATNVARQDAVVPPTDEQLLEVLRTAGQAGSAGSGGSSGDGGGPAVGRKTSVTSQIAPGLQEGKRYSIGQTIHVPAGYAPGLRAQSPYTTFGAARDDRQYRRAGIQAPSPVPEYGRQHINPNHPKFAEQSTATYYHPGQRAGPSGEQREGEQRYRDEMYEEPLSDLDGNQSDASRRPSAVGRSGYASPVPQGYPQPAPAGYISPSPHGYAREDPRYGGFGAHQQRPRARSNAPQYTDPTRIPTTTHQRSRSSGSIYNEDPNAPYEVPPDHPEMPQRVPPHTQYPPPPTSAGRGGVSKHMQHRLPYARMGQLSPIPASPSTPTSPIATSTSSTPVSPASAGTAPASTSEAPIRYNLDALGPVVRPRPIPIVPPPGGSLPPPPSKASPTSMASSSPPRSAGSNRSPIVSTSTSMKSTTNTPNTPATPRSPDDENRTRELDAEGKEEEEDITPIKSPALSAVLPPRVVGPIGRRSEDDGYEEGEYSPGYSYGAGAFREESEDVGDVDEGERRWREEEEEKRMGMGRGPGDSKLSPR